MPDCTWLRVGRVPGGTSDRTLRGREGLPTPGRFTHHVSYRSPFPENDGIREVWPLHRLWGGGRSQQSCGCDTTRLLSLQGTRALPTLHQLPPYSLAYPHFKSPDQAGSTALTSHRKSKTHPCPGADPCKTVSRESPGQGKLQENLDWTKLQLGSSLGSSRRC